LPLHKFATGHFAPRRFAREHIQRFLLIRLNKHHRFNVDNYSVLTSQCVYVMLN